MVEIAQMGTDDKLKKLTRDHTKTLQLQYQHDPSMGSMGSSKQTF